jgi:hypothetical protein
MTLQSAAVLLMGAVSALSCVRRPAPAGEPQTVAPIISTTAPATSQPDALAEGPAHAAPIRLTSVRLLLLTLQRQYLTAEGPARRSMKFVELAGAIDETRRKEPPVTEMEALDMLGSPDYARYDEQFTLA